MSASPAPTPRLVPAELRVVPAELRVDGGTAVRTGDGWLVTLERGRRFSVRFSAGDPRQASRVSSVLEWAGGEAHEGFWEPGVAPGSVSEVPVGLVHRWSGCFETFGAMAWSWRVQDNRGGESSCVVRVSVVSDRAWPEDVPVLCAWSARATPDQDRVVGGVPSWSGTSLTGWCWRLP